jgi:hypothetical protein
MTKQIFTTLCIAFVAVCLLSAIVLFQRSNSGIRINRDRTAVVSQIQQLNRLETSVFTIEKIIDAQTGGNVFQRFLFGDKILLIAHGRVVAGVDFAKLNPHTVQISKNSISLLLPPSEIFNSDLDETKTTVYDRSQGILSRGNMDLESEARKAAEAEIYQAACDSGILAEAANSAEEQVTSLLRALQFTEITVTAPAGEC